MRWGLNMKTQTQHTPGPWRFEVYAEEEDGLDGAITAERQDGTGRFRVAAFPYLGTSAEMFANGSLLAAAPELLAAAQIALCRLEGGNKEEQEFNSSIAKLLRDAIAKAEGR